ncbi:MAG: acyl-CoA thioesterase [Longimicrobiales bacterium]
MNEPRSDYPFSHDVEVRFRDLDSMGHAHHTLPLVYFEEARAALWRRVTGQASPDAITYVLGEVAVRYHTRIRYPQRITVGIRLAAIGGSSFRLEYAAWSGTDVVLATGWTTQVLYDAEREASTPIPDALRARLTAFAGEVSPAAR